MRDKMNNTVPSDFPPIFPTKSWKKYSHLFISDFDQDELKLLNAFYDYGELAEEYAKKDNDFFWVTTEERAKVSVQKVAEFAAEAIKNDTPNPDQIIQKKKIALDGLLDRNNILYSPQKSVNEIRKLLPNIPKITTSSCGKKLKKLAKLEV
jgi:acetyl-CoA acetyltransferase